MVDLVYGKSENNMDDNWRYPRDKTETSKSLVADLCRLVTSAGLITGNSMVKRCLIFVRSKFS